MAGKKGMKPYSVEIKLEAVRMFLEEGKTRAEIAKLLGLRSEGRVKKWVSQYRPEQDAFHKPIGRPRKQLGSDCGSRCNQQARQAEVVSAKQLDLTLKEKRLPSKPAPDHPWRTGFATPLSKRRSVTPPKSDISTLENR